MESKFNIAELRELADKKDKEIEYNEFKIQEELNKLYTKDAEEELVKAVELLKPEVEKLGSKARVELTKYLYMHNYPSDEFKIFKILAEKEGFQIAIFNRCIVTRMPYLTL